MLCILNSKYVRTYNNCNTLIVVHEMHGRMHPNYCQITILLVVDLLSLLVYLMMTHSLYMAGNLPIIHLIAKQPPTSYLGILGTCVYARGVHS